MNMQELFSTPERVKLMAYLIEHPDAEIGINALARKLSLSPGQVHKYASLLRKNGLLEGKRLSDSPEVRAIRLLGNLSRIGECGFLPLLRERLPSLKGAGVYGSWAAGSNSESSDLDVWLKLEKEPKDSEVAALRRELEALLGTPVDLLIATPERLAHLRSKSEPLFYSLHNSILLWGEGI